jgi:two-component system response regulator FixJ
MCSSKIAHVVIGDHATRHSLCELLQLEGYAVKAYPSARSFLNAIEITDSGFILIDVQLPDIDGLELLLTLTEQGINLPAIVMSGLPDPKHESTARILGAVDFFETPVDPEILLAAIRNTVSRSLRQAELSLACQRLRCPDVRPSMN